MTWCRKWFSTPQTTIGLLSRMNSHMPFQLERCRKWFSTPRTTVGFLSGMNSHMPRQLVQFLKWFVTQWTRESFLSVDSSAAILIPSIRRSMKIIMACQSRVHKTMIIHNTELRAVDAWLNVSWVYLFMTLIIKIFRNWFPMEGIILFGGHVKRFLFFFF